MGFTNVSDYFKAVLPAVAYLKVFYSKMDNKFENIMSKYQNLLILKRYSDNTQRIYWTLVIILNIKVY